MEMDRCAARSKGERGSVTIVVVLLLIVLIGFAAFAIDVGQMMVRRNELQNIADTAALAAMGELGSLYSTMTITESATYTPAVGPLLAKAQAVASATGVGGVTISGTDFQLGVWYPATHTFLPTMIRPTAVRVNARRDTVANGPFTTFLAGVLGMGSFNVSTTATASLTSLNNPANPPDLPVGISLAWFSDPAVYCNNPIKLYPTNDPQGCAGWHVYDQTPSSANTLRQTIDGLTNGTYVGPQTVAGVTEYDFTGGNIANALRNMSTLFNAKKVLNDGVIDQDNDPATWTTTVPVYNSDNCSNPSGTMLIVGFSTIVITNVTSPPAPQEIWAKVVCDNIVGGRGGNGLGIPTWGSIPNLVQ